MTTEALEKKETKKQVTFKCKCCGEVKPLDEMRVITRFFPPIMACLECEKKMR